MNVNNHIGLNNKVAIITGAATGIGAAAASILSAAGVKVLLNHLPGQEPLAENVAGHCVSETLCFAADVTDDRQCHDMIAAAVAQWGQVNILVNNAGINKPVEHTDLSGLDADDFIKIYRINVIAAYQMIRAATPVMQAQQDGGVVVNISSGSGEHGYGSSVAYAASKGAINTMTKSLARALAPAIRMNALCPGMVITPLWDKLQQTPEQRARWLEEVIAEIPLHKEPTPTVIARNILYLASDLSAHITGQLITADGGAALGLYHPMYNDLDKE